MAIFTILTLKYGIFDLYRVKFGGSCEVSGAKGMCVKLEFKSGVRGVPGDYTGMFYGSASL